MFTVENRKLRLENRISLLAGRNKENGRIIKKLRRQLVNIDRKETAAAGPETV